MRRDGAVDPPETCLPDDMGERPVVRNVWRFARSGADGSWKIADPQ